MEPSLNAGETDAFIMLYILLAIICVALFYNISILWRRLHDLNLPGWPCLIFVVIGALAEMPEISGQMSEAIYIFKIPLFIIGIVLLFVRGTVGPNKYGPDPLGGTAPASPEPLSADAAQNLHWSVRSTTDLGKATANNNDQPR